MHTYARTRNSLIISASHSCCKLPCTAIIYLHDNFQLVQQFLIIVVSQTPLRIWWKQWTFSLETWKRCVHMYTHTHSQVVHTIPGRSLTPIKDITATHEYFERYCSSGHTGELHFLADEISHCFGQWNASGSDVCESFKSLYSTCYAFSFHSATETAGFQRDYSVSVGPGRKRTQTMARSQSHGHREWVKSKSSCLEGLRLGMVG